MKEIIQAKHAALCQWLQLGSGTNQLNFFSLSVGFELIPCDSFSWSVSLTNWLFSRFNLPLSHFP